jgi:IclR family transcriptional regulator, acetate operon repressor
MPTTENNQDVKAAQAVSIFPRVMDTLYALTSSEGILSVRTIAEATGNSRSSTHRILQSMAESGYAEQRQDGGYTVGPRLIELAARVFGVVPVLKIADSVMTQLEAEVGETCYLASYSPGDTYTTFIHRVESDHPLRHVQPLGTRLPLHAGAIGKAVLAASDVDPASIELTAYTPRTLTTRTALVKDLKAIRSQGYATSVEERVVGVAGVAAPLMSGDTVVGGLSVSIPASRVPKAGLDGIGIAVRKRAQELSLALTAMGVKRI